MIPTFSMIPWNSSALTLQLKRRGVANESIKGSFEFDVVFTSNQPGFVVQYIRKNRTYKKTASSRWKKTDRAYWEIFYIGDDRMSWNADRFAQTSLGKESEGGLIQIGYAYFFPYDQPPRSGAPEGHSRLQTINDRRSERINCGPRMGRSKLRPIRIKMENRVCRLS